MKLENDGNTVIETFAGREYAFAASGSFGGGTLTLQYSIDGGTTWVAFNDGATNVALTSAGGRIVRSPGRKIRFSLSGSTAASVEAILTATE